MSKNSTHIRLRFAVKVGDWGLARRIREGSGASSRVWTMAYAAPEILRGEKYDHRVDLYALGAALFELLKGEPPFMGSEEQILRGHLEREPGIPGGWPKALREVIARSLAKRPEERFASASEMQRTLMKEEVAAEGPDEDGTERVRRGKGTRDRLQERAVTNLEVTVSNPHYADDLRALDDTWDQARVLGPETVVIVTGCHMMAELLDRPVAEMLRDEIDRRGDPSRRRRAIIVGDSWWERDADLQCHPVISIGGPAINSLTSELSSKGRQWDIDGLCGAIVLETFPRVALWGDKASETRQSVDRYIRDPEGLAAFLRMCWK